MLFQRLWVIIVILFLLIPAVPCSAQNLEVERVGQWHSPIDPQELEAFLDRFFTARMSRLHIPGATFVLVKDGKIFFSKGYGYADLEKKIPVDPEQTIFGVGSVTKLLTATAVMQLVEQGKLSLNQDVNHYLQDFQVDNIFT